MSSALLTEHFFNPANVGEIDEADGIGRAGLFTCGAALRISLRIDDSQRIASAQFKSAGCSYLVAACSLLTTAVKGMTTGEAAARYETPVALIGDAAGEWPSDRIQCAALAGNALVAAIRNYSDSVRDEWSGDDALICTCFGVSERKIEDAIEIGSLRTIAEVTHASKAGAGCRSCWPLIQDMLDVYFRENNMQTPTNHS